MPKQIDLTGRKFGMLLVVKDDGKGTHRKALCLCECGTTKRVAVGELRRGATKSCGCYQRSRLFKPVLGKTFGRLTVIAEPKTKGKRRKVQARCTCGNVVWVAAEHLRSGHTSSCGCYHMEVLKSIQKDLTGMRFGQVTVIKDDGEGTNRKVEVKCDCGTVFMTGAPSLTGGSTTTCGCLASKYKGMPRFDSFAHQISYADIVRRSHEDHILLETRCTYCGQWYMPSTQSVQNRIAALIGRQAGEQRFYCTDGCKSACPIYNQTLKQKAQKKSTSREVVPLLRQIVLKRDAYTCQKCGEGTCDTELHVHHILGAVQSPMTANDPDNCITLCIDCHEEIHSVASCRRSDLKCS